LGLKENICILITLPTANSPLFRGVPDLRLIRLAFPTTSIPPSWIPWNRSFNSEGGRYRVGRKIGFGQAGVKMEGKVLGELDPVEGLAEEYFLKGVIHDVEDFMILVVNEGVPALMEVPLQEADNLSVRVSLFFFLKLSSSNQELPEGIIRVHLYFGRQIDSLCWIELLLIMR
jgi:hypothetical protein